MRLKASTKILLAVLLIASVMTAVPLTSEAVTPSSKEYTVTMQDSYDVFIGNEKPAALTKGKEVYFVYTVASVDEKATTSYQHGVAASDSIADRYVYEGGGVLQYSNNSGLLEEGYTYFIKFAAPEGKLECTVVRANGDDREVVSLPEVYGEATDAYQHVGLWFGCGTVTAELSHVLCYDQDGNDLGVFSSVATIPPSEVFQYDTKLQQSYSVTAKDAYNVAIYNEKKTDSDVIYIEYTVKSSESNLYQTGLFSSRKAAQHYPHNDGFLAHENFSDNTGNGFLLVPGASYIVKFTKGEQALTAQAQRTIDGEHETYSFPNPYGTYAQKDPYVGLWFGEGLTYLVNFELINVKCYDEDGNSLGVTCNQSVVEIIQQGEKADYSDIEGVYYSAEENALLTLYGDKSATVTKDGKTEEITYEIWENTINLNYESGKESYVYTYQRIFSDKVIFNRLNTYYVTFETGTDETIETQTINAKAGYVASKPKDPTKEGATFEGWVLSDGTEYDFDSIVSETLTLYAKWSDEVEYHKSSAVDVKDAAPMIAIASAVLILAAAIVISVIIMRRGGKKHGKN